LSDWSSPKVAVSPLREAALKFLSSNAPLLHVFPSAEQSSLM
jgi:hypothetical protein